MSPPRGLELEEDDAEALELGLAEELAEGDDPPPLFLFSACCCLSCFLMSVV